MTEKSAELKNRFEKLSSAKRLLLIAICVSISIVVLVLIAETFVRIRQYYKHGTFLGFDSIMHNDTKTGMRILTPNVSIGPIRINSLGFRGPEIKTEKSPSTLRIAFLGGSTTFCAEVSSNESVWAHIVWNKLSQRFPESIFDYINTSVSGYTVSSSVRNLRYRVKTYNPNIIVIYHAVNDISINGKRLAEHLDLLNNFTEGNGSIWPWLTRVSLLADLGHKNISIMLKRKAVTDQRKKIPFDREFMVSAFRRDLRVLVDTALETANLVVLPTFSTRLRHDQDDQTRIASAITLSYYTPFFTIIDLLEAFDAYNIVIREFAKEPRVVVIETANEIPGDKAHFVDSVHFTDRGSALMGDLVAEGIANSPEFAELLGPKAP